MLLGTGSWKERRVTQFDTWLLVLQTEQPLLFSLLATDRLGFVKLSIHEDGNLWKFQPDYMIAQFNIVTSATNSYPPIYNLIKGGLARWGSEHSRPSMAHFLRCLHSKDWLNDGTQTARAAIITSVLVCTKYSLWKYSVIKCLTITCQPSHN